MLTLALYQYAYFFSFPITFIEHYHWNDGKTGLALVSIWIGLAGALFVTPQLEKNYLLAAKAKGGKAEPEDRLPGMLLGSVFIPICEYCSNLLSILPDPIPSALFIFAWTSPPTVQPGGGNWVGPVSSGIPFGFGMVTLYFSANAYIIDAFPGYVASALAAKTVVRSGAGAAMPLFITAMYHNLGIGWASSTWGFISFAMVRPFVHE